MYWQRASRVLEDPGGIGDGKVVKDPNRRVVEAIEPVFGKFREMPSFRQTVIWFRSSGVELLVGVL